MFYEDDTSPLIHQWDKIYYHLFKAHITDIKVWDQARENERPPHIGNIYQDILLSSICEKVEEEFDLSTSYYLNAQDTHLYINSIKITSFDEFLDVVYAQELDVA